jgi:hypothetical protein
VDSVEDPSGEGRLVGEGHLVEEERVGDGNGLARQICSRRLRHAYSHEA